MDQSVDLYAVQPFMEWTDYVTEEAFFHKISGYFVEASKTRRTQDAVIVFPEDIATFLLLLNDGESLAGAHTMDEAFLQIGRRHLPALLGTMLKFRTFSLKEAFFVASAPKVWAVWHRTMCHLARLHQMTVVAGTALLPRNRFGYQSPQFAARDRHVYNLGITISPEGVVVAETAKVNLVPTQEDLLALSPGSIDQALKTYPLAHSRIPLATAICYDAFRIPHTGQEPAFQSLLPHLDSMGARILAQPSANPWWWDEPWVFDGSPHRTRHQQWYDEGSWSLLRDLKTLEVIINPQLLMEFLDLHFDGQSSIVARTDQGAVTLASSHKTRGKDAEEVLHVAYHFSDPATS